MEDTNGQRYNYQYYPSMDIPGIVIELLSKHKNKQNRR